MSKPRDNALDAVCGLGTIKIDKKRKNVENEGMKTIKPYLHKVNYYETDKMGITHHSNYIRYMEEARVDFLDQLGWSFIKLEKEGMASPVMSVEGVYKKSTTFPDTIEIMVGIEKLSAAS